MSILLILLDYDIFLYDVENAVDIVRLDILNVYESFRLH